MAITYDHKAMGTGRPKDPVFYHRVTIAYSAETYTTDGMAVDWEDTDLDDELVDKTIIAVIDLGSAGYHAEYDYTADKLKVFYCDNNAVADGPYIEHPASALTATFQLLVVAI